MIDTSRILVVGRGHLGTFLAEHWKLPPELHWSGPMEALSADVLRALKPRPSVVVNCAGKTDLRWCEDHPRECFQANVAAPLMLYRAAASAFGQSATFIHMSSGCIWDGPYSVEGKPFGPLDPPTPACFYSWSKAACDACLFAEAHTLLYVLRPRQVYSPLASPRNTLGKLLSYPRLLDTPNSMTSAATIARTIERIGGSEGDNYTLNVYDRGVTSPYEVGMLLAEAGLRAKPERLEKSDLDAWHKPKRVDTVLFDEDFETLVNPPTVQEELRRVIGEYVKNLKR